MNADELREYFWLDSEEGIVIASHFEKKHPDIDLDRLHACIEDNITLDYVDGAGDVQERIDYNQAWADYQAGATT